MTTRDHLIYRMQEIYSFQRDFLALLDLMINECAHTELCQLLRRRHESIKGELEPLERGLNVLGAQYKMERHPLPPAFKEITSRFKHQMNPSREQLDVYILLQVINVANLSISDYRGNIELARALASKTWRHYCKRICSAAVKDWKNWRPWRPP